MSFLRRLLGGAGSGAGGAGSGAASGPGNGGGGEAALPGVSNEAAELEYERELLREESRRLADDLLQRQLRYADHSWTPPAQGGEARAGLESTSGQDR